MKWNQMTMAALCGTLALGAGCYSHVERERVVAVGPPATAPLIVETPDMPAPRIEEPGPAPGSRYVWEQGHWKKVHHGWEWHPGHWEVR